MTERVDDRIRELFEEVDAVAPTAPPLPIRKAPATGRLVRLLVPAGGVAFLLLIVGLFTLRVGTRRQRPLLPQLRAR